MSRTRCYGYGVLAAGFLAGCGVTPVAEVGHPAPYTAIHLRSVSGQIEDELQLDSALKRHFGTTEEEYQKSALRLDHMLDETQRASAFFQTAETLTRVQASFALAKLQMDKDAKVPGTAKEKSKGSNTPASKTSDAKASATKAAESNAAKAAGLPSAADAAPPTTQPEPGQHLGMGTGSDPLNLIDSLLTKAFVQAGNSITDGPFDQLDRASDFYLAYMLKLIRLHPDSRAINLARLTVPAGTGQAPEIVTAGTGKRNIVPVKPVGPLMVNESNLDSLEDQAKKAGDLKAGKQRAECLTSPTERFIMLYWQVAVEPGTRPNCMASARVKILGGTLRDGNKPVDADQIKIIRLHPTRTYDLDSSAYGESFNQALDIALRVTAPLEVGDVNVDAGRQARLRSEVRRQFISRIGKQACFIDASRHVLGWNFFPSNLEVVPNPIPAQVAGWLLGTPREFKVESFLEGGGRDCAAFITVPSNLATINFKSISVSRSLDPIGEHNRHENDEELWKNASPRIIQLPAYDPLEADAPFLNMAETAGIKATPKRTNASASSANGASATPTTDGNVINISHPVTPARTTVDK